MNPIKRQTIIFCALMMFGLVAIGLFMNQIHDKSKEINNNWLPSVAHVSNINTLTSDFRIHQLQHILSLTNEQMRSYENEMQAIHQQIDNELKLYEPLIATPFERKLYSDFIVKWKEYLDQNKSMIALSRENRNEEAKSMIRAKSETLFDEFSKSLSSLVAENRHLAQQEMDAGNNLVMLAYVNLFLIIGLIAYAVYKISQHLKNLFDKMVSTCVNIMTEMSV